MNDFRYKDSDDAIMNLNYSAVRIEDDIVFLRHDEGWVFSTTFLSNGKEVFIDIRELGITFEPIELGYINRGYAIYYLIRDPKRMWKAGITIENTRHLQGHLDMDILSSREFLDMANNEYPSITNAYKRSMRGNPTAFHRNYAMVDELLMHKGQEVGFINDDGNLEVFDKFNYIREELEEICLKQ